MIVRNIAMMVVVAVVVVGCVEHGMAMDAQVVPPGTTYSVYYDSSTDSYTVEANKYDYSAAAYGAFDDRIAQTGWGGLVIHTNPNMDDAIQVRPSPYPLPSLHHTHTYTHIQTPTHPPHTPPHSTLTPPHHGRIM